MLWLWNTSTPKIYITTGRSNRTCGQIICLELEACSSLNNAKILNLEYQIILLRNVRNYGVLRGGDAHYLQGVKCEVILASHRSHAVQTSQKIHAPNNKDDKWSHKIVCLRISVAWHCRAEAMTNPMWRGTWACMLNRYTNSAEDILLVKLFRSVRVHHSKAWTKRSACDLRVVAEMILR